MNFEALIEPAWKQVAPKPAAAPKHPGVMWSYRLTPPMPSEWPMTPKSTLVRWVFAAGMDVGLRDGERVAAPWGRVDVSADGTATFTAVSKSLEGNDIQGVRPITKAEADVVRQVFETSEALRAGDLAAVKEPWCRWLRYNGVIAAKLKPKHEAFFTALACDAK
ncbi:MAG: hypothetical protein ABTQ32_23735 [Myxococcaceae bacterium]